MQLSDTNANIWDSITALFNDNRLQLAVYAKQEFLNIVEGEISITLLPPRVPRRHALRHRLAHIREGVIP
jgi:hypothetical protein